ncbi:MAG: TRAP transporter TatT component family protein [Pseudomonadota bacterium]|nr:TRAP transporter TatT component family protein [Pseudomonadota bacterium]
MKRIAFLLALLVASGCASIVSSVTDKLAEDLSRAILNNDDLATVREGVPAFLIVLDALLTSNPDNPDLLTAAARLNASYATGFVADQARQSRLTDKAMALSYRAACSDIDWLCNAREMPFQELESQLIRLQQKDVPTIYAYASSWAGWIQSHSDDWAAIAELARVKALMEKVVELDAGYDDGAAVMYLGVFETLLPPAMGGRPEVGRGHFERAIEISDGRYLMAKVLFAEKYARLVFDRQLHDTLLTEVLIADPYGEALTLINLVAQDQAAALLKSADEYF